MNKCKAFKFTYHLFWNNKEFISSLQVVKIIFKLIDLWNGKENVIMFMLLCHHNDKLSDKLNSCTVCYFCVSNLVIVIG